jgi:hypothetical protein
MTPPEDDDRDRERPSWREMDRLRDRSKHTRPERREPSGPRARATSQAAKQAYLRKLDEKIFGGKGSPAEKDAAAVRDARGTRGFSAACDAFVEKRGFPESPDLLLLFLDHENPDVVLKALEVLAPLARENAVDRDALGKALRRVKAMTDDPDVEAAALALLSTL